ncbi:uncharacterized protein [Argopecten irradians]|uniref:uncharacterized protein n=1 Tax=Argopecten irradians TaxID=31199 RepID=UPI00371D9A00
MQMLQRKMEDNQMSVILKKLDFDHAYNNFEREKITPDIVGKLSAVELGTLGIVNSSDMMKLRTECVKYGHTPPAKVSLDGRAPVFDLPKCTLEYLLDNGFQISDICKILQVSESTVYRRMRAYNLSKMSFCDISNDMLDLNIKKICGDFPLCGENMIKQILSKQLHIKVQRWRIRDSIHRIDSKGVSQRCKGRLHRRVYNVLAPNHLWHIDTNHKLVRWRFVIAGGIDGFSRKIMFLKCCDNNRSETVFQCFSSGVSEYGTPNKVRSDKGLENIDVANFMLSKRGLTGFITGKSTHNQRIERLWRDVYEGVLSFFYNLFYYMEDQGILDCLDITHLQALHYIYMNEINRRLHVWSQAWDAHRIRTVKSSPQALWIAGQFQNTTGADLDEEALNNIGEESFNSEALRGEHNERPIFGSPAELDEQCMQMLALEVVLLVLM